VPDPQDASHWQRVEDAFHRALDLSGEEREQFFSQCRAQDPAFEREVREILNGYEKQERLSPQLDVAPIEGRRYGAFEIVRKIGEGGMGAVYLARRYGDFAQRAAVKLINGTPAAVALMAERFRQEREILAGLEHPNIARVLDGGVTPEGQPYLAMEYVEGARFDEYVAAEQLTLRQRLAIFRKICGAVHYAHQHLVIHRDLKPGNILVDQHGEPKLLDFGIAKVLSPEPAAPAAKETQTAGLLMTPQFASPEQIQGLPCTVASDVYSLGVILYQLIARQAPYPEKSPAEVIAAVVSRDPARPSTVAPGQERSALRGDLDGIVLKAMAKRPEDRYGSAEQLAEDVRSYLEGRPVTAVEGTRLYVARKFAARHRVGVAAVALVLLSLVAGMAGTLWQARRAERERLLAEQHFSDARKLAKYLLFPLYDSVQTLPGSLPVRADMAAQSLLYLDRLAQSKSNDRELNLELAEGYMRLGGVLEAPLGGGDSLGNTRQALASDQKALALLESLRRDRANDARVERDFARLDFQLGPALNFAGKPGEAAARLHESARIFDRLAAANPRNADAQVDAGRTYVALMDVLGSPGGGLTNTGNQSAVLASADRALARFRAALAVSPNDSRALLGIARAENLAGTLQIATDPRIGMATIRNGLDALRRLPAPMRELQTTQIDQARMETMIAFAEAQVGDFAAGLATLEPARQFYERMAAADPKNATNTRRRINVCRTRAMINLGLGHKDAALDDYRKLIGLASALIAVDPSKTSNYVLRGEAQGRAAKILASQGHMDQAGDYAKASIEGLERVADRPDAAQQNLSEAAIVLMTAPVMSLRDYARALGYAKRADELGGGKSPEAVAYLAQAYANTGDARKALETIQRALALVAPPPPGQKPSDTRQTLEEELRGIQILLATGRLPKDFNK
jgi:tetratricopeptide (TPR) repeat protein